MLDLRAKLITSRRPGFFRRRSDVIESLDSSRIIQEVRPITTDILGGAPNKLNNRKGNKDK